MKKLSTGKEIGFNIGILALMLLFLNIGLLRLISEAPAYPNVPCDPAKGPTDPVGCGTDYEAAQTTYQEALNVHETKIFWASIILAITLLCIGLFVRIPAASWGLMLSGVGQFIIGTIGYWDHLNKWTSTLILGLGAGLLLFAAWKYARR